MKKIILILLFITTLVNAQKLLFDKKPNYLWVEQLADSNKFYTATTGDWTLTGSGSITRNADSSLTYSNIPQELNPNPNFADWSYIDLLSGWDFTSGWAISAATILDNNSFSTAGYGGLYRSGAISGLAQNDLVKFNFVGNVTSSSFDIVTTAGGVFNLMGVSTGSIDYEGVRVWGNTTYNVFLRNQVAGTTDVTSMSLEKLVAPDGWTASTMSATNYVKQDDNGLRLVSDGGPMYIVLSGFEVGKTYKYKLISSASSGALKSDPGGCAPYITFGTGTYEGTFVADYTGFILNRNSACDVVVSYLSFTEVHDENYIALPYQPTQNQVHELSFDYEEGETSTYQSDFSAGVNSWSTGNITLLGDNDAISDGVESKDDVLSATINTVTSSHRIYRSNVLEIGSTSKVIMEYYIPSSNTQIDGICIWKNSAVDQAYDGRSTNGTPLTIGEWSTLEFNVSSITATTMHIYFYDGGSESYAGNGTDVVYFRNIRTYVLDESQSIESAKLIYIINNQTDSTETVTTSYQTSTKKFVGGSDDTLKISLSDTGKVKIKNPSIKLRVKQ